MKGEATSRHYTRQRVQVRIGTPQPDSRGETFTVSLSVCLLEESAGLGTSGRL